MRKGRKRANTSFDKSLNVALGTSWVLGWARMRPMMVRVKSFIKGTTADKRSSFSDLIFESIDVSSNLDEILI